MLRIKITPTIYEDNSTAIKWACSEESTNLKHIVNLCFHFIRLEVTNNNVKINWVSTKDQLADIFTKPLGPQLFLKFRNQILFT